MLLINIQWVSPGLAFDESWQYSNITQQYLNIVTIHRIANHGLNSILSSSIEWLWKELYRWFHEWELLHVDFWSCKVSNNECKHWLKLSWIYCEIIITVSFLTFHWNWTFFSGLLMGKLWNLVDSMISISKWIYWICNFLGRNIHYKYISLKLDFLFRSSSWGNF
jgi:hypothetical protein